MKRILFSLLIFILLFSQSMPAFAGTKKTAAPGFSAGGQYIKARNLVRTSFLNLKGVAKVNYTLLYKGNGIGQGVMGSFKPGKNKSISRDFYLGTCSRKVCTPHKNIKNIELEVTTKYTNGKSSTKLYKVK